MSAELPTQLLTTEDVAFIWQYDPRTIATWTGGRKKKPQITLVRNGREIRFTPQAVLEHILVHTIQAAYPARAMGPMPRLAEEDIEKLWGRIERFIQVSVKAELAHAMQKEAA